MNNNVSTKRRKRARNHCRGGWSLVELIAVITLMALLATLIVPALANGFQAYRNLRTEVDWFESTSRLGLTLRRDIRQATDASLKATDDESELLTLISDEQSVTYQLLPEGLERRLESNDGRTTREGFMMPPETKHTWNIERTAASSVSLTLDLPGPHQNSKSRQVVLRGYLGRNVMKEVNQP